MTRPDIKIDDLTPSDVHAEFDAAKTALVAAFVKFTSVVTTDDEQAMVQPTYCSALEVDPRNEHQWFAVSIRVDGRDWSDWEPGDDPPAMP